MDDYLRGTGRTTRMLRKAHQYADAHPDHRIWIVCAHQSQASMLKANWRRKYGVGHNNVEFINLHQAQNAYSHTTYKVFWDHYAAETQLEDDIKEAWRQYFTRVGP